jgi:glutamyl-tRNA synthetase
MADGRFAPSPTGPLHLGSLRTALLAWLFARSTGSRFLYRIEDLDPVASRPEHEAQQLDDVTALGIDHDGPVVRQSQRRHRHEEALAELERRGLTYRCYCTRREVREAVVAPHGELPEGAYPGTCRALTVSERVEREAAGRRPAVRLLAHGEAVTVVDRLRGPVTRRIDDFVLRRGDGVPSYNVAVVVDDADQGVEEVVRGDDLLDSTPRQAHLADLLDRRRPAWAHVPLVLGPDGQRLAKRHGAVSLGDLRALGWSAGGVRSLLAASLGLCEPGELVDPSGLIDRFDPGSLPIGPWQVDPHELGPSVRAAPGGAASDPGDR